MHYSQNARVIDLPGVAFESWPFSAAVTLTRDESISKYSQVPVHVPPIFFCSALADWRPAGVGCRGIFPFRR